MNIFGLFDAFVTAMDLLLLGLLVAVVACICLWDGSRG